MSSPARIVFDAEPIIAHAADEPGSGVVATHLDAVRNDTKAGLVNYVTLTEVHYILARQYNAEAAQQYLEWVLAAGVTPVPVDELWREAADVILDYNPPLGDAIALATAAANDATLLVGADDDYDDVTEVTIDRFRTTPA